MNVRIISYAEEIDFCLDSFLRALEIPKESVFFGRQSAASFSIEIYHLDNTRNYLLKISELNFKKVLENADLEFEIKEKIANLFGYKKLVLGETPIRRDDAIKFKPEISIYVKNNNILCSIVKLNFLKSKNIPKNFHSKGSMKIFHDSKILESLGQSVKFLYYKGDLNVFRISVEDEVLTLSYEEIHIQDQLGLLGNMQAINEIKKEIKKRKTAISNNFSSFVDGDSKAFESKDFLKTLKFKKLYHYAFKIMARMPIFHDLRDGKSNDFRRLLVESSPHQKMSSGKYLEMERVWTIESLNKFCIKNYFKSNHK